MASEAGIVDVDEDNIISNYHMKSEEIFGLCLKDGEILENKYLKAREASKKPYGKLVSDKESRFFFFCIQLPFIIG